MLSENELIPLYIGLLSLVGAFFGAVISTFLSRSHKVSEFRQRWINSVRDNFSKILYHAELYAAEASSNSEASKCEHKILLELFSEIKLYLNLKESSSKQLLELLEKIPNQYAGLEHSKVIFSLSDKPKIESLMQEILKDEWNRVRDGEMKWRLKKALKIIDEKYFSPIVFIYIGIFIAVLVYIHYEYH